MNKQNYLLLSTLLFFGYGFIFSADARKSPQDYAKEAFENAVAMEAISKDLAPYGQHDLLATVNRATLSSSKGMRRLFPAEKLSGDLSGIKADDLVAQLTANELKVFDTDSVQNIIDLTSLQQGAIAGAYKAVVEEADVWPGWQIAKAGKAWSEGARIPWLSGGVGKTLALLRYAARLPLPRKSRVTRDVVTGAATVGAAGVTRKMVQQSAAQPTTINISVADIAARSADRRSSDNSSIEVRSMPNINLEKAGKAALVLALAGAGIGVGKVGYAWWAGASDRSKLHAAAIALLNNNVLASLARGQGQLRAGQAEMLEKQGELLQGQDDLTRAVDSRLSTERFNEVVAELVTTEGLRAALEGLATTAHVDAAVAGLATQEELQVAVRRLATADSVAGLTRTVLTKTEFNRVKATFATARNVQDVLAKITAVDEGIADKVAQVLTAREVVTKEMHRAQQEAMREMLAHQAQIQREEVAAVAKIVKEQAEAIGVRVLRLESALTEKMVRMGCTWQQALQQLRDEHRAEFEEAKMQRLAMLVQGALTQRMIGAGIARMGGSLTPAELEAAPVTMHPSVAASFATTVAGSPTKSLPVCSPKPSILSLLSAQGGGYPSAVVGAVPSHAWLASCMGTGVMMPYLLGNQSGTQGADDGTDKK